MPIRRLTCGWDVLNTWKPRSSRKPACRSVRIRPPTASPASSTRTVAPAAARSDAHARPARPAPTTTTRNPFLPAIEGCTAPFRRTDLSPYDHHPPSRPAAPLTTGGAECCSGFVFREPGGRGAGRTAHRQPPVRPRQRLGEGPAEGERAERLPGAAFLPGVRPVASRAHRRCR